MKVVAKDYNFGFGPDTLVDQFDVTATPSPLSGTQKMRVVHARPGLDNTQ